MTKEDKISLGKRLKAIRAKRGVTIVHLAAVSGMTRQSIGQIERGTGAQGIGAITAYAAALGLELKATYNLARATKKKVISND